MFQQILSLALICPLLADHDLRIHNKCSYEIWIGFLGGSIPDGGEFMTWLVILLIISEMAITKTRCNLISNRTKQFTREC